MPTTSDHDAIAALISRHAVYSDDNDAHRRALLYAQDGEFIGPDGVAAQGFDAIFAAFSSRPPMVGKHMTSNVILDIDGDAASGRTDFMYLLAVDEGFTIAAVGHYEDRFVRTDLGWRFAQRRICPQR